MPHPDLDNEQDYLDHAYRCLEAMRDHTARLAEIEESAAQAVDSAVVQAHLQHRLASLNTDVDGLSFGRLDEEAGATWYVGRRHVEDPRGDPVVVDWRAEVSTPFYRATAADPLGLTPCAQRQIDDYRRQNNVGGRRNIAMARYNVDGQSGRQFGVSGRNQPGSPMPQNPMFNPGRRDADSEWKILEDLANQLNLNPLSSGRIHIYSERPVCPSCQGVIRQFRAAFPGIELSFSDFGR